MQVSVIIPTRDRVHSLSALLDSLDRAQIPDDVSLEVFVVNNGSTDNTAVMLKKRLELSDGYSLIILEQELPGKSRALNSALAELGGDLVVVLDDDVIVDQSCIAKHVEAHRQTGFAAVQGRVLPGKDPEGKSADPRRLSEYNIPFSNHGDEICEIRGVIGTNASFKRAVIERVGLFDVRLGPGASGFSEDTDFSLRMRRAGFKIGYAPDAVVYHELNPARYGRAYHRDQQFRQGVSRSIYRRDSIAFRVVPNLVANGFRWLLYRMLGQTQKAYKTEGRVLKSLGYLAGKVRRSGDPRGKAGK